jgi:ribonuclease HII
MKIPIMTGRLLCGIDEAGRGPLAGPVYAAAVILDPAKPRIRGLTDSKLLSPDARETYAIRIRERAVAWAVASASVEEIDRINILRASHLAMLRAFEVLPSRPAYALVDGNQPPNLPCPITCIIGGDAISVSIAAASIIAKVERDKIMRELAVAHPVYGWETNVGYSTRDHLTALKEHGPTPFHRKSFRPVYELQLPLD